MAAVHRQVAAAGDAVATTDEKHTPATTNKGCQVPWPGGGRAPSSPPATLYWRVRVAGGGESAVQFARAPPVRRTAYSAEKTFLLIAALHFLPFPTPLPLNDHQRRTVAPAEVVCVVLFLLPIFSLSPFLSTHTRAPPHSHTREHHHTHSLARNTHTRTHYTVWYCYYNIVCTYYAVRRTHRRTHGRSHARTRFGTRRVIFNRVGFTSFFPYFAFSTITSDGRRRDCRIVQRSELPSSH